MSPTYFVVDVSPVYVYVEPTSVPSVPDQISYVEYDDVSIIHAMNPASGDFANIIFIFNPTPDPAFGSVRWGEVKALYR